MPLAASRAAGVGARGIRLLVRLSTWLPQVAAASVMAASRGSLASLSWPSAGRSRNLHDGNGPPKLLVNPGPPPAIRLSAFKQPRTLPRNLRLTPLSPAAIENHLSVRVIREPLQQIIVQCRILHRDDK